MIYYTGDSVPLAFTITDKDGGVEPNSVQVDMLKPGNQFIEDCSTPVIESNKVSCVISGDLTNVGGLYKVYFVCALSYGERTHKMEFRVTVNPERER